MRLGVLFVGLSTFAFMLSWRSVVLFFVFVWVLFRVVRFMLIFILLFLRINLSSSHLFNLLSQVVNIASIRVLTVRITFILNLLYLKILVVWLGCSYCSNHIVWISVWVDGNNVFWWNWTAFLHYFIYSCRTLINSYRLLFHYLLVWLYIILKNFFFFPLLFFISSLCLIVNYNICLRLCKVNLVLIGEACSTVIFFCLVLVLDRVVRELQLMAMVLMSCHNSVLLPLLFVLLFMFVLRLRLIYVLVQHLPHGNGLFVPEFWGWLRSFCCVYVVSTMQHVLTNVFPLIIHAGACFWSWLRHIICKVSL